MKTFVKRKLRQAASERLRWKNATPQERIEAVEIINRLAEPEYAKQAFPRVYRVTRKARG